MNLLTATTFLPSSSSRGRRRPHSSTATSWRDLCPLNSETTRRRPWRESELSPGSATGTSWRSVGCCSCQSPSPSRKRQPLSRSPGEYLNKFKLIKGKEMQHLEYKIFFFFFSKEIQIQNNEKICIRGSSKDLKNKKLLKYLKMFCAFESSKPIQSLQGRSRSLHIQEAQAHSGDVP